MLKNECGSCNYCCEALPIPEIQKPESILCKNCTINQGCNIYNSRPNSCKNFDCLYLQSDDMDVSLRPNECKVMFEMVTDKVYLGLELPQHVGSWRNEKVYDYIKGLNDNGISVVMSSFSSEPKSFMLAKEHTREGVWKILMNEYGKIK